MNRDYGGSMTTETYDNPTKDVGVRKWFWSELELGDIRHAVIIIASSRKAAQEALFAKKPADHRLLQKFATMLFRMTGPARDNASKEGVPETACHGVYYSRTLCRSARRFNRCG